MWGGGGGTMPVSGYAFVLPSGQMRIRLQIVSNR
jgi:hypothetical protein